MSKIYVMLVVLLSAVLLSGCAQVQGAVANVANVAAVVLAIPTAGPPALPPPAATDTPPLALSLPVTNPTLRITVAPTPTRPAEAPGATPQAAATATPAPRGPTNVEAVVQAAALNVRGGPGVNHPIVAALDQDQQVEVVGRNTEANWFELRLADGRTGWVSAEFVQLRPAGSSPRPAPAPRMAALLPSAAAPVDPAPVPPAPVRRLEVSFINPHYECENRAYELHPGGGLPQIFSSRRSFQFDLYLRNTGTQAVAPPWRPARWTITDGAQDLVTTISLEWPDHNGNPYPQPVIPPGQMAGWTFRTVQLQEGQWVKAVEFVWNGETYRQNFDLGPYGHSYNYRDCDR